MINTSFLTQLENESSSLLITLSSFQASVASVLPLNLTHSRGSSNNFSRKPHIDICRIHQLCFQRTREIFLLKITPNLCFIHRLIESLIGIGLLLAWCAILFFFLFCFIRNAGDREAAEEQEIATTEPKTGANRRKIQKNNHKAFLPQSVRLLIRD